MFSCLIPKGDTDCGSGVEGAESAIVDNGGADGAVDGVPGSMLVAEACVFAWCDVKFGINAGL